MSASVPQPAVPQPPTRELRAILQRHRMDEALFMLGKGPMPTPPPELFGPDGDWQPWARVVPCRVPEFRPAPGWLARTIAKAQARIAYWKGADRGR